MRAFVLAALLASLALAREECGENEHFETCGTACPLTCDNYRNPPKICVLRCDIGCHCDKGYVRSAEGRCVKPEECPSSAQQNCGENQRYTGCGSACPLTCENYANPPKICPAMCFIGCECEEGFVKTKDEQCVRPEDCPHYVRPLQKSCSDGADPGYCMGYFLSWYFDTKSQQCLEFVYGGCQGNGNRYDSKEECLDNCASKATPEACQQEKVVGPCRGHFLRFYFNKDTGKCESFVYGGCQGNSNNFNSQDDCEGVCLAQVENN